jgi:hypothetical protein
MTGTTIKKIYVDKHGIANLVCPKCGDLRKESVEPYKSKERSLKIQCRCMNVYEVELEFRQTFRKETSLNGKYFGTSNPGDCGRIIVKDLSLRGCRFETTRETALSVGEEIRLELMLDEHASSATKKKAVVSHVKGRFVGCKFCDPPGSIDQAIAFYLRAV